MISSIGCKAVLKKMYGFKQPDYESYSAILKFQEEVGFGGIPFSGLKPDVWFLNKRFSSVDVYVFNKDGKYIPYKDTLRPNCNGPAELFLTELRPGNDYHFSDEYTLDSYLNLLEGAECQKLSYIKKPDTDFFIFMTYACFTGKRIIKEKSKIWLDSLRNNTKIRYQLCLVNMDLKSCWSEEQKNQFESKK